MMHNDSFTPKFYEIQELARYTPSGHKDLDSVDHFLNEYYEWCESLFNVQRTYRTDLVELSHYSNLVISRLLYEIRELKFQLSKGIVSSDISSEILEHMFEE